jgi:hypothetical protein
MTRFGSTALLLLATIAIFAGIDHAVTGAAPTPISSASPSRAAVTSTGGSIIRPRRRPTERRVAPVVVTAATPARDREEVRQRLRLGERGTYIRELLLDHDSSLVRWPDRTRRPLRVWIQPMADLEDWELWHVRQVREAFEKWMTVDIPVRFTFAPDSASADIHVNFVDQFDEPISGKTVWARDESWWIVDADIYISVHYSTGEPLDESAVFAITLHEVGHLLGLDHCSDPNNIMSPRVRVRELSAADRATAQLLYRLPPGAVR